MVLVRGSDSMEDEADAEWRRKYALNSAVVA
jgi:hypothetical protein